jgi:hypothetical protein
MKATLLFALVALCLAPQAQAKSTSEYTSLSNCKMLINSEDDPEAPIDYFLSVCKGREGMDVVFAGGDSRSWIDLAPAGTKFDHVEGWGLTMDQAQGQFPNIAGNKLEWRYNDGKLTGLIVRTTGQDPDSLNSRETLTVVRLDARDKTKGCVIGVVNAKKPNANLKARMIADSAGQCPAE